MKTYIKYKLDTGQIVQTGTHPNPMQLTDELHGVLLGQANDATHYVCDGELVELPVQPTTQHTWDGTSWVDTRSAYDIHTALMERVRAERDRLLKQSDWTQVADAPVDQEAWRIYRQALRDITASVTTEEDIVWPTQP